MQDRMFESDINTILGVLEYAGLHIITREPETKSGYRFDALLMSEHNDIRLLTYLEFSFPHLRQDLPFNVPFPILQINPSNFKNVHNLQKSSLINADFEITTRFRDRGDLTIVEKASNIPSFIHKLLDRWNVLDEVSANSESHLFELDINPNNKLPDSFTPKGKRAAAPTTPTASAKFDHGTKACVDAPPERPGLDFEHIAASIVGLVDEIASEPPKNKTTSGAPLMTIGLYGPWGAGKSTLIRALKNEFESDVRKKEKTNYLTATINPWKWDGKGTIHNYVYNAFMRQARHMYPLRMTLVALRHWLRAGSFLMGLVLLVLIITLLDLGLDNKLTTTIIDILSKAKALEASGVWPLALGGIGSFALLTILLTILNSISKKVGSKIDELFFSDRPASLGADGLATAYQDIAAALRARGGNRRPFVFFFDDLDRCPPDRVAEFAESVHSLTAAGCVTFISCDEHYVAAALKTHHNDILQHFDDAETRKNFGRRFLEKIVQIPYRVPSVQEKHLKELGIAITRQNLLPIVKNKPLNNHINTTFPPEKAPSSIADGETNNIEPYSNTRSYFLRERIDTLSDAAIPFSLSQVDNAKLLMYMAIDQENPDNDDQALGIAAFVLADRYLPGWLDNYTGFSQEEINLSPESDELVKALRECLGDNKAALRKLYAHVSMRLPNVMSWLLSGVVESMRLNIRQVKALSNTINLHLRIGNTLNESDARRIAAFVFADMHDADWLDRLYHGLDGHGTQIGLYPDLDRRLREVLGTEAAELLPLYGQIGRHPALRPPGEPVEEKPDMSPIGA